MTIALLCLCSCARDPFVMTSSSSDDATASQIIRLVTNAYSNMLSGI